MRKVFVLGAAGFVGREVVRAAVARGFTVGALLRTEEQAQALRRLGASPVKGDARAAEDWISELADADAVLDLIQPPLPARLGGKAIRRVAAERIAAMTSLTRAISTLPSARRPLLFSVSGMADLSRDPRGVLSAASARQPKARGFAGIGIPVHEVVVRSQLPAAFVHLGTVYGPGKAFAARLLPSLARGRLPVVGAGTNRMALIHVSDAARALVHLLGLERELVQAKTWLLADGANTTQREFLEHGARLMRGPVPRRLPRWLVSLLAGSAIAAQMTEDAPVDNAPLLETGFRFEYASHHTGLPATVRALPTPAAARNAESATQVSP